MTDKPMTAPKAAPDAAPTSMTPPDDRDAPVPLAMTNGRQISAARTT